MEYLTRIDRGTGEESLIEISEGIKKILNANQHSRPSEVKQALIDGMTLSTVGYLYRMGTA